LGKIQWLSIVPENPIDSLTSAKSNEDEQMFSLNCTRSMGKTHFISQNATVFLFFLKMSYKIFLCCCDFMFILKALSIAGLVGLVGLVRFFLVSAFNMSTHIEYSIYLEVSVRLRRVCRH
jgi:hypothetical protein